MSQRRYELSDFELSIIEPSLPNEPRGVPNEDDRKVLNGIYWRLRTGSPWADIPERYGPATTCYNRFVCWRKLGVWDRLFEAVSAAYAAIFNPSTVRPFGVRRATGTSTVRPAKRGSGSQVTAGNGADTGCMGRSCAGSTTKIHALVDANGLPVNLKLAAGQAHDGRSARDMLGDLGAGQIRLDDRAYDSDAMRDALEEQGAWANVGPMPNRKRILPFGKFLYRYGNVVERFFSKIEHYRAIATRYDRHPENYLALVKLAAIRIRMRVMSL